MEGEINRPTIRTEGIEVPPGSVVAFAGEVHYPNGQSALVEVSVSRCTRDGLSYTSHGLPGDLDSVPLSVSSDTLALAEQNKNATLAGVGIKSLPIEHYIIGALAGIIRSNESDVFEPPAAPGSATI